MIRWGLCCIFREVPIKFRHEDLFILFFLPVFFNHFLGLVYSFGDQDRPRTTLGAFEVVPAGPDAIGVIKCRQALHESQIASVRQKSVGLGDGCRP